MRNIALITLVINLAYGFTHREIDNFAHLGGLVGGFALAALLGPNPALLGRSSSRFARWALDVPPALAVVALIWALVYWASGKAPEVTVHGPAKDYSVRVPLAHYYGDTDNEIYLSDDGNQHWLKLLSLKNDDGGEPGKPGLIESRLERYREDLGKSLASGQKLAAPAEVVRRGRHRFVHVRLVTAEGAHEEAYATATEKRLYVFYTKGLEHEAWMRPTLERMLDTFEPEPTTTTPTTKRKLH
jgi:hypothetical protein